MQAAKLAQVDVEIGRRIFEPLAPCVDQEQVPRSAIGERPPLKPRDADNFPRLHHLAGTGRYVLSFQPFGAIVSFEAGVFIHP